MRVFDPKELKNLYKPRWDSAGEDNGQVTIIGGSKLFHGAPLFALKIASRIVDMVFFETPEKSVGYVAETLKSKLLNFIWTPWEDLEKYIKKSDAILIGPGFMRYESEKVQQQMNNNGFDGEGEETKRITQNLLKKFSDKKWVIDAGSLQVMEANLIPKGSIITPNTKEFSILFEVNEKELKRMSISERAEVVSQNAKKHSCVIVSKGPTTIVCSPSESLLIEGGNPGLTKGGSGDSLSGLAVALLAKNEPFLSACSASYIAKETADRLFKKVGTYYNSDDLADAIPKVMHSLID